MKTFLQLLSLLALFGVSCSTAMRHPATSKTTTFEDLASAYGQTRTSFEKVRVSCTIVSDSEIVKLPNITIEHGRSSQTDLTSSMTFPTDFEFPEIPKHQEEIRFESTVSKSIPVTPAKPIKFGQTAVGWNLNLTAEPRNSFVMLQGFLTQVKNGDMIRAEGVPFRRIIESRKNIFGRSVTLTRNRAERPVLVTEKIPILIAARSNESYRVYLDASRTTYADFHCVLVESKDQKPITKAMANKAVLDKRLLASGRNELGKYND